MRWLRRTLSALAAVVGAAALTIAAALWWSLPPRGLATAIPGLSAPVHVALDDDGVPRIRAANALDGAAALGFMHARDRMFQMDLSRRVARGQLSEIAGDSTLRLDRTMRTLGLGWRAEADLAVQSPDALAMLDAYARGVNAWIALRGRFAAPEFIVLGTPAPWTPVDSMLWGKTMALYLSGNWRQELGRATMLQRMPPDRVRALWPGQANTPSPDARLGGAATRLAAAVPAFPEPFTLPGSASNEWAVDGAHSITGAPLLAGDPHLAFGMPGIWYLARVQTPQGVLAGATAPGVPFLIIGHNGRIAWTFTTTGADTQDVFIETPTPDGGYLTPDGPARFITHTETIHVRNGPDQTITVRETRHGPVLSDLDGAAGPVLAVAMANLAPGDAAPSGLLALNRASTVAEAGAAAPAISSPVQNLLVADRQGIGQFTTGRVPVRRSGDGTLPTPGADGQTDWTGYASGMQLPHVVNPASGHLVNANERTVAPDFPVFLGQDWFGDWRARRIRTLLDARTTHSVNSFAQMQVDPVSAFAQAVMPRLLRTPVTDRASRDALSALRRWDGAVRLDRPEGLLFNAWMRGIEAALMQQYGVGYGVAGVQSDLIARALGPDEAQWCGPGCDAMLAATLADAVAAHDPALRWGEVHQAEFQHPLLGRLPLVGRLFTWRIGQAGDDNTLDRGTPAAPGWTSVHGAAYRGVYDLADLDRSVFALAPGQSGHFLRHEAASLLPAWRNGTTLKLGPTGPEADSIELHP